MEKKDLNRLLLKEPFKVPMAQMPQVRYGNGKKQSIQNRPQRFRYITQAEMLQQYYPESHKIFWREDWQDEWVSVPTDKADSEGNPIMQTVKKEKQRRALSLQQIIVSKRLSALTGYDVEFQDSNLNPDKKSKELLANFKRVWLDCNFEVAKFDFFESYLITGDAAAYFYLDDKGKPSCKVFSFLNGDTIIPQYDAIGNLISVTRVYETNLQDLNGDITTQRCIDVIDNKYYTTYSFGWDIIRQVEHGMETCPCVYARTRDGAVWNNVQELCDALEFLLSTLAENNKRTAFAKLLIKTEGEINIQQGATGESDLIQLKGTNDTAEYLKKGDVSSGFDIEIEQLWQGIMLGAHIVMDSNKSMGDQPSTTSKLKYSPELIAANECCKRLDSVIDGFTTLFKKLLGKMKGNKATDYEALNVNGQIKVYTVIDNTDLANMICSLVDRDILSKTTARALLGDLSAIDEDARVQKQMLEENEIEGMQANLLNQNTNNSLS